MLNGSYAAEAQEAAIGAGGTPTETNEASTGLYWSLPCASSLVWTNNSLASFASSVSPCSFVGSSPIAVQSEGIWFEPANGTKVLADNFTLDSSLNANIWTTSSSLLSTIANTFSSSLVSLNLDFLGSDGMQMSGVNGYYQFGGIQTQQSFTPPFSVQVNVTGTQAVGNSFVVYLSNQDFSQFLTLSGNLSSSNTGYYGIWVDDPAIFATGQQLGVQLQPPALAALDTDYTIDISVNAQGAATVSVQDTNGTVFGTYCGLQIGGNGPFYLVLGQREGLPSLPAGPNVADWSYAAVTTGSSVTLPSCSQ